jgi:hypothetical protein
MEMNRTARVVEVLELEIEELEEKIAPAALLSTSCSGIQADARP